MQDTNFHNPYQATAPYEQPTTPRLRLASRGKRLIAAILDNIIFLVSLTPALALFVFGVIQADSPATESQGATLILAGMGVGVLTVVIYAGIQIYLLAVSSQSIGKYFLNMQIVDVNTLQPSPFMNCFLLRSVVGVALLGQVPFYGLADALFIFREDHRCIHDLIGNSYVVDL